MKLLWTDRALENLGNIYIYYTDLNIKTGAKIVNGIIQEAQILITFPHIGHIINELNDLSVTYRSLIVQKGKYRILYFISQKNDFVSIVSVMDCRQDISFINSLKEHS